MKTYFSTKTYFLIAVLLLLENFTFAQRASVSVPIGVNQTNCGGSGWSPTFSYFGYNEITNTLSNAVTPTPCVPALRIGGSSFPYTTNLSSVSYNPKDTNVYYLWTNLATPRTYIWKWPVGSCPGTAIDTVRSFNYDILGVTFDNNGIGYMLEFEGSAAPYRAFLRTIDFTTGSLGQKDTLQLLDGFGATKTLYTSGTGDIGLSPDGKMYFVCDNKLFTPQYQNYGTPARKFVARYIDTVIVPNNTGNLVALTYAQGELITSYSGYPECAYYEVNPGVSNEIAINNLATNKMIDAASIVSSLGVSKRLVSFSNHTGNTWNLSYEIQIKNMGTIPLSDVRVFDTLTKINPLGVVSNVSTSFVKNPGNNFALNPSFNGNTNTALLSTAPTKRLRNFPIDSNNIIIRIDCRISNLLPGTEYLNRAFATAIGFRNIPLRDSSTNGANPDLNGNGVADDRGENVPTPFYLDIAPPLGACPSIVSSKYMQTFGAGTGVSSALPLANSKLFAPYTQYIGSTTNPLPVDRFAVSNNPTNANTTMYRSMSDHTGDVNGRMLIVNADVVQNNIYIDTVNLCGGHEYTFRTFAVFLPNAAQQTICAGLGGINYSRMRIRIVDFVTGQVISQHTTTDITSGSWTEYSFRFNMPTAFNNVIIQITNVGNGGCGNDFAIDDIEIGTCSPDPILTITAPVNPCAGFSATFSANITNSTVITGPKAYRLENSIDGVTWTTVANPTSNTYTIATTNNSHVNKFYRFLIADSASGNISSPECRFSSNIQFLAGKLQSVIPDSVGRGRPTICPGDSVTLRPFGGEIGTNAKWYWYTGSCAGTLIDSGYSIRVAPNVNTTYYVRAVGECNTTACRQVTVVIGCDIDDENDGIPDIVEYSGIDAELDYDFDGIPNYRDRDAVGFIDTNFDNIDDRYDADLDGIPNHLDRDSDNDGIPDVVESNGVDNNGDGIIDNYTDTDGDGLSQNVDASGTGWRTSGNGLGNLDFDGDGIPNFIDVDSDGDGIPDIREVGLADANNNGRIDNSWSDANGDGLHNSYAVTTGTPPLRTGTDINSDGRADSYTVHNMDNDSRPNPYDLDSDGDGLTDVIEQMYARWIAFSGTGSNATTIWDGNLDGMADGQVNDNGYTRAIDALSSLSIYFTDGDSRPDYLDIDSDNDGITDNIEGQTTFTSGANYRLPTTADTDRDGIADVYENAGDIGFFRGGNINPLNIDGDLRADYLDSDADNDGTFDNREGNDWDLQGDADETITLTNTDTDADGLDNRFDTLTGPNVTSRLLGNAGSFTGPTPGNYGTRAVVSRDPASPLTPADRRWRNTPGILAVANLSLQTELSSNNKKAQSKWNYSKKAGFATVYFQRSIDGINFELINTQIVSIVEATERQENFDDDIENIRASKIYYRVKIMSADGDFVYSNITAVKNNNAKQDQLLVWPNPASKQFNTQINVAKKGNTSVKVYNAQGQLQTQKQVQLQEGTNIINFDCSKWAKGVYIINVDAVSENKIQKLLVQ